MREPPPLPAIARRRFPVVEPSTSVLDAAGDLDIDDPDALLGWLDSGALACGALVAIVVASVGELATAPLGGCLVAVGLAWSGRRLVAIGGTVRRTRALGRGAALVGRAALHVRLAPTPEGAASFAAGTGDGMLAASLRREVEAANGTPRSGLEAFASEWGQSFPPMARACALLTAATAAPPGDRERLLERAVTTVRDGMRDRAASFAADARSAVAGIYAGGVMLPLALVGVLPAAEVAGVGVPIAALAFVYDCVLPIGVAAASASVLADRPVAFPAPTVPRTHPSVPASPRRALVLGGLAGGAGAVLAGSIATWAAPLGGVGAGVGVAAAAHYRPTKRVRDGVREVEAGLPDAATLLGRRVAGGAAVERALSEVAAELPGPTGRLLRAADERCRRRGAVVEAALTGSDGVLEAVPSPRALDLATMIGLAVREGRPAGDLLVATGEHLDALERVEREARRELATTTRTLANTAALFGPLVGGATVALAGRLSTSRTSGATATGGSVAATTVDPVHVGALGLVVGTYALLSAATLTALATALERGLDRALIGYRVGLALPTATTTYLAALVGARAVL